MAGKVRLLFCNWQVPAGQRMEKAGGFAIKKITNIPHLQVETQCIASLPRPFASLPDGNVFYPEPLTGFETLLGEVPLRP
ncbi:hypothetical protein Barb6_02915 [Bacteroidales bacterium Barb6]|nr:hypothetical protein Barb6_02915 [Bacteroidales bacterium Barb6]